MGFPFVDGLYTGDVAKRETALARRALALPDSDDMLYVAAPHYNDHDNAGSIQADPAAWVAARIAEFSPGSDDAS
jgi:hypothetical protein